MKTSEAMDCRAALIDDAWQSLAEAIVEQACEDYRRVLKGKRRTREYILCRKELEHFFRSDWFETLCSLDGDHLMRRLQNEHRCVGGRA